jgi:hypothetical protein
MPYVVRDEAGQIIEVHAQANATAIEKIAPNDPALRVFLGETARKADVENALVASDLGMIRVLEDLIAVLIDKRIIMLTDLPKAAQQKLARRYELRSKLQDLGGIVSESDEVMLP